MENYRPETLLSRVHKEKQTFHIFSTFYHSSEREEKMFSSDLLTLHEMHIVIRFMSEGCGFGEERREFQFT